MIVRDLMDLPDLLREISRLRVAILEYPVDKDMPHDLMRDAIQTSRRVGALVNDPELSNADRAILADFGAFLLANGLPYVEAKPYEPALVTLTRADVVRMMRYANDSGADLWMALSERFGIEDDELKRQFKFVIREDVIGAAWRVADYLRNHPRGAIPKRVREDLDLVLSTLAGEGEVVE